MKKLLFFIPLIISFTIHSFNIPAVNPENLTALKQQVTQMRNNAQADIDKNSVIAAGFGMASKMALIGSIILLTSNRPREALAAACAHGICETIWYTHISKAAITRTNASVFEFFEKLLPAQNALPNDKNQQ